MAAKAAVVKVFRKAAAARAAAPGLIEDHIRGNIEQAKAQGSVEFSYYMPRGGYITAFTASLLWFRDQVKKGGPMDYKDPTRWAEAFPGLPFPGESKAYTAFGIPISASDLGNLNFGAVGNALGFPETLLLQQAGAAQLADHRGQVFLESQWNSLGARYYGDEEDDYNMIKNGFAIE